jgi:predicted transcriptional regulator of viral defense system
MASAVAAAQWGVIDWRQLQDCGVSGESIKWWLGTGRLHLKHSGVYAYGHPWLPVEGRMVAAILHAGAGTVLSHATAAWWWGLIDSEPTVIDVSTPTRARSTEGVAVHHPRRIDATTHRRFPITTVARTLVDYAARATLREVRQALAEAEYRRLLDVEEVLAACAPGRRGSKRLRRALARHQPKLALTRSDTERRFFGLCERAALPLPEVNAPVSLMRIDMVWPELGLAVELDGYEGHHTRAQMERDRGRELHARMAGLTLIRYTWNQVTHEPGLVVADLSSVARSAGSGSRSRPRARAGRRRT